MNTVSTPSLRAVPPSPAPPHRSPDRAGPAASDRPARPSNAAWPGGPHAPGNPHAPDDDASRRAAAQGQALADARLAAALLAIDPAGGLGVWLRGPADPRREQWLDALRAALPPAAPLLRMPLHIDDERLLGGLDLAATLSHGRVVAQAGLLTRCHGGVLLVAMAERVGAGTAARLSAVLDQGRVQLQRDGLVADLPTRFGVVALDEGLRDADGSRGGTGADAGDDVLAPALADRLAVVLDLGAWPMRLPAAWAVDADRLAAARTRLRTVEVGEAVIGALCQTADALGVASLRAPLLAVKVARLAAAWAGHAEVDADDTALAARLVLAPRATRMPAAAEAPPAEAEPPAPPQAPDDDTPPPDAAAPPPPADAAPPDERGQEQPPPPDPSSNPPPTPTGEAQPLPEQVLEAALAAIPPGLLALLLGAGARSPARGAGKSGAWQAAQRRGRPLGSRRGELRAGARLHLIDTLRAAAPWQTLRRRELAAAQAGSGAPAASTPAPTPTVRRVLVRPSDFRIVKLRERRETTTVFVVDASGSSALHRLAEAKGAIELLLAECYVRRDRVALIAFRGPVGGSTGGPTVGPTVGPTGRSASTGPAAGGAELLLPPTRSLARARRSLAGLPGGGGTPLAAGLDLARELAGGLVRRGGSVLTVLLTDGRANLARDGSPGRPRALSDALTAAQQWRVDGLNALLLDTSPQPQAGAQQVARAMGARYLPLPHADARQLSAVVQAVVRTVA